MKIFILFSNGKAAVTAGRLTRPGMSKRTLFRRVAQLGEGIGLKGLSAHDCRHYWSSQAEALDTLHIDIYLNNSGFFLPSF